GAIDKLRISDITARPGGAAMAHQRPFLSRRAFLRTLGVASGGAVIAPAFVGTPASAQEAPSPLRPDPAAKRGGTLRYAVHNAPAHFDVHQSGTVANIGPQSPMYDTLLRRSPKDGQTIIPDLAWTWEIAPDNKKYTFHLRTGVKFHDGADCTAEENQGNLRQVMNYPGTGPFKHVSRKDKEVWIQERNADYWNKGLPLVDRLEVYHMFPFSPELGSSFLAGKVDYARLLDPVSW